MRISIWQQFSSNHSASFTVMGKFKTPEEAEHVGEYFRSILERVVNFRERTLQIYMTEEEAELREKYENSTYKSDLTYGDFCRYTFRDGIDWEYIDRYFEQDKDMQQLAHEMKTKYDVDFDCRRPYLEYTQYKGLLLEAVKVLERAVIVSEQLMADGYESWSGPMPFKKLVPKLGGELALLYVEPDRGISYITITCQVPDEATMEKIMASIKPITHVYPLETLYCFTIEGVFSENVGIEDVEGTVHRDGLTLTFKDLHDYKGRAFLGIIPFLQSQGCTNIDYHFRTEE